MSVDVWRRGCGSGCGQWLWSDPRHSFSRPHTPTLLRVDSTKQGKGAAFDASRGVVLSWSHIQFEVDVKVKVPGGGPCKKVCVWFVSHWLSVKQSQARLVLTTAMSTRH